MATCCMHASHRQQPAPLHWYTPRHGRTAQNPPPALKSCIPPDALGAVPPEKLGDVVMEIAPAVQLLSSPWPIYDLWAFNTYEGRPKPQAVAQDVVIFRPEFDPAPAPLAPGALAFVRALVDGATLGVAAEKATEAAAEFDLSAALGLLLSNGAITKIKIEEQ